MGAGSGFTNLPVSETDARLQSGGHMGRRRRKEKGKVGGAGGGEEAMMTIMKGVS